jgi:hypothetical protein
MVFVLNGGGQGLFNRFGFERLSEAFQWFSF